MSVAADRFAGLLGSTGAAAPPRPAKPSAPERTNPVETFAPAARLLVRDGLHQGAWMSLRSERLSVGSADNSDIVLTDTGMPPLAGHFVRGARGWQLEGVDIAADKDSKPLASSDGEVHHGRWRRRRWQLHGVTLVVIDSAPPVEPAPVSRAQSRRLAWRLVWGMAATLLVIAGTVVIARAAAPSPSSRIVRAMTTLQALQLPDVRLRSTPDGAIELVGHVANAAQLETLTQWQQRADLRDARLRVHQGTALVDRVREALGNPPDVKISYTGGGHVRIDGSTRSPDLKRRVRGLTAELRDAVSIDDHLALSEVRDGPAVKRALPLDIVNVMQGDRPYFQTAAGATYFVGATMPDGAVVVLIDPKRIEFVLDGRPIVYPLTQ
jgi:hypothetical protein